MARLRTISPRLGVASKRLGGADGGAPRRARSNAEYSKARWRRLRQRLLEAVAIDVADTDPSRLSEFIAGPPALKSGRIPVCQKTGVYLVGGRTAPNAAVVDHILPARGDEALLWDETNLQVVCKRWHDSTKQAADRRGEGGI